MSHRWRRTALAAFAGHLALSLYLVERVRLNADEGWTLYAAGLVTQGSRLYADLLFFQGPVMPLVYGGFLDFGPGMLLGARWISLLFLLMATGLTGLTALRVGGMRAAAVSLLLVGLHPLVVGSGVWAKPYALAMLLLAGGLFLWSGSDRPLRVAVGALLFGLAAGARLSLLPVPLLAIWASSRRPWAALGALVGLGLAFRTAIGVPVSVLWTQLVGVHLPGSVELGSAAQDRLMLLLRLGFLLAGFLSVAVLTRCGRGGASSPIQRLCVASVVVVGMLHLLPGSLHVEHVVVLAPALGVLAGAWSRQLPDQPWAWAAVAICLGLGSITSLNFVKLDTGGSTLSQAAEIGRELREEVAEDREIFTLQTTLAVEAGRRVPRGFEMGRFGWSLGGLDRDRVIHAMGGPIGAVALAEGDFADDPVLRLAIGTVLERVGRSKKIDRFGQFGEPLLLGLPPAPAVVHPGAQ